MHPVLFWMDSSVRIQSTNITPLFEHVMQNGGISIIGACSHSNACVTFSDMYLYLPTNESMQWQTDSFTSTMFYVNTRHNFRRFMHWHVLCALERRCIAPTDKLYCDLSVKHTTTCHRYDMSSLNLLLSHIHNFNTTAYGIIDMSSFVEIERGDEKLANDWGKVVHGCR